MQNNEKPVLLIDAYNIFARAYCVVPLMSSNGYHIGGTRKTGGGPSWKQFKAPFLKFFKTSLLK